MFVENGLDVRIGDPWPGSNVFPVCNEEDVVRRLYRPIRVILIYNYL